MERRRQQAACLHVDARVVLRQGAPHLRPVSPPAARSPIAIHPIPKPASRDIATTSRALLSSEAEPGASLSLPRPRSPLHLGLLKPELQALAASAGRFRADDRRRLDRDGGRRKTSPFSGCARRACPSCPEVGSDGSGSACPQLAIALERARFAEVLACSAFAVGERRPLCGLSMGASRSARECVPATLCGREDGAAGVSVGGTGSGDTWGWAGWSAGWSADLCAPVLASVRRALLWLCARRHTVDSRDVGARPGRGALFLCFLSYIPTETCRVLYSVQYPRARCCGL